MPSIISTYLKRAMVFRLKTRIPYANAIRVGAAVVLVMAIVGVSKLSTRRESLPARKGPAHAAVQQTQRPLESSSAVKNRPTAGLIPRTLK